MGKMGDTWRGVETSTRTGETDQGVTQIFLNCTGHTFIKNLLSINNTHFRLGTAKILDL